MLLKLAGGKHALHSPGMIQKSAIGILSQDDFIKTQWKTVQLLKDLSDTMVDEVFSSEDSNATKSSTIDSCLQFVSAYNEKSKKLLDKCDKVLRN